MSIPYPVIIVRWRDTHADANGWTEVDELDPDDRLVRSVGWLLPESKPGYLSIAQSYDGSTVDSVLHILAASIHWKSST